MMQGLKQLENIFSEETFNRKPLINYTVEYFDEINKILVSIKEKGEKDDEASMLEMASLAISRNAQHIISLYIMGFVGLENGKIDENYFERLIVIFKNIKKWNIVEYLANFVLKYFDADYALKALASYYQSISDDNKAVEIWEKLVHLDKENYELAERVASHKEKEGNIDEAIKYYKIVFEHNLEKHHEKLIETNLKKILEIKANNITYMLKNENALAEVLTPDTMIDLWKIIFFHYFDDKDYPYALKIIKHLLKYEQAIVKQNNKKAKYFRHRLVDVYKGLYPTHSLFKEIEEMATLTNVFKDPKAVIEIFERYIKFDKGKYVYHREFGVGIIKSIDTESVLVEFAKLDSVRKMTFEMVIKSLIVLEADDVLVYKSYKRKELVEIANNNPNDFMIMMLKYREGGIIATKDLKQEVVPDIISEANYNKWLDNTKKAVRAGKSVKFDKNTFVYNKSSLSYDDEMMNKFNDDTNFFNKYDIYLEYKEYSKDLYSSQSKEMYQYFVDVAKDKSQDYSQRITSILLINHIEPKNKDIQSVGDIIADIKDYNKVYESLPSSSYKEIYVNSICAKLENYADIIKKFLYSSQVKHHNMIIEKLVASDNVDILEKTIDDIILRYKEFTESFLFFATSFLEKGSNKLSNGKEIHYNKTFVMVGLMSLIEILTRLADKKESSTQARKMLKVVYGLLFEKNYLQLFIDENDKESVRIVFSEFQKMIDLENHYKTEINTAVARRFPDII